jgi:hypothetical protein
MTTNNAINSSFVGMLGTTTNDNAAAGTVGEYISGILLIGSGMHLTSASAKTIFSISLTAGDWEGSANLVFDASAGGTATIFGAGISTSTNTMPAAGAQNNSTILNAAFTANLGASLCVGSMRLSLASTTPVYLIGTCTYTGTLISGYGFMGFRRMR